MTTTELINRLVSYAVNEQLIQAEDRIYCTNQVYSLFKMDGPETEEELDFTKDDKESFEEIIEALLDKAYEKGLIEDNTVTWRDIFDSKLMNIFIDRPGNVIKTFHEKYKDSPEEATNYYYKLSCDSNYIKRYRIKKDLKWVTKTDFGDLDITINLSKPEKDPKAIAAAKHQKQSGYPKCLLCVENEGYPGRINHPGRANHRIIPLNINNEEWFMQYSPYVYYNEHCIVFNSKHTPMTINPTTWRKLFDFVSIFPHYIIGSNADLPIVGGSILTHEHFQGGRYVFPLNKAPVLKSFKIKGFGNVKTGIVKWPMSVIRLESKNQKTICNLADHILEKWRAYTDKDAFIFAETNGEKHNTITPIASRQGQKYILDLVLRNNITTEEHPLGVYHPHENLHHIKKENIGLIEVMGLAVLPSRLKNEMEILKETILNKKDILKDERISSHAEWVNSFRPKYPDINEGNIEKILQEEIGQVFAQVLRDAGVYKQTENGLNAFEKFIKEL